jgi:hypothetical protein
MDPKSLSMDYWNLVNVRNGDFKLSYSGIKVIHIFFQSKEKINC